MEYAPEPGEQATGVAAAEQRGSHVDDVPVDQPGTVEVRRPGRHPRRAPGAPVGTQLVQDVGQLTLHLPTRLDLGRVGGGAEHGANGVDRSALGQHRRVVVADRERRIILAHGPLAFDDRVGLGTGTMARQRAGAPVIHWLEPSGAAVAPSMEAASFSTTQGRPVVRCWCRAQAADGPRSS